MEIFKGTDAKEMTAEQAAVIKLMNCTKGYYTIRDIRRELTLIKHDFEAYKLGELINENEIAEALEHIDKLEWQFKNILQLRVGRVAQLINKNATEKTE